MSYNDANKTYADAHAAGTLCDADYVEWIVSVQAIHIYAVTIICHKYIGHNYMGHDYRRHNHSSHNLIGYNYKAITIEAITVGHLFSDADYLEWVLLLRSYGPYRYGMRSYGLYTIVMAY